MNGNMNSDKDLILFVSGSFLFRDSKQLFYDILVKDFAI